MSASIVVSTSCGEGMEMMGEARIREHGEMH